MATNDNDNGSNNPQQWEQPPTQQAIKKARKGKRFEQQKQLDQSNRTQVVVSASTLPSFIHGINVKIEEDSSTQVNDKFSNSNCDATPQNHHTALPSKTIPQLIVSAPAPSRSTPTAAISTTQASTATDSTAMDTPSPQKAKTAVTLPEVKDVLTCLDVLHDASTVEEATNAIKFMQAIPRLSHEEQTIIAKQFYKSHGLFILTSSLNNYYASKRYVWATLGALFSILWYEPRSRVFFFNESHRGRTLGIILKAALHHRGGSNGNNGGSNSTTEPIVIDVDAVSEFMEEQIIQRNAVGILRCMTTLHNMINVKNGSVIVGVSPLDSVCIDFVVETMELYPTSILIQKGCVLYFHSVTAPMRSSMSIPTQTAQHLLTKRVPQLLVAAHSLFRTTMRNNETENEYHVQWAREALNSLL